jgi:tetratricopeptide (TPR) repeat protein
VSSVVVSLRKNTDAAPSMLGMSLPTINIAHLFEGHASPRRLAPIRLPSTQSSAQGALDELFERASAETQRRVGEIGPSVCVRNGYRTRPGLDDQLHDTLNYSGGIVVLAGARGTGKSSLCVRLAQRLVAATKSPTAPSEAARSEMSPYETAQSKTEQTEGAVATRQVVALLSGAAAFESSTLLDGNMLLARAVREALAIPLRGGETLLEIVSEIDELVAGGGRPTKVWLILDELEETGRTLEILQALDECLPKLHTFSWLSVVVALRSETYASYCVETSPAPTVSVSPFLNCHVLHKFAASDSKEERPFLELSALNSVGVASASASAPSTSPHAPSPSAHALPLPPPPSPASAQLTELARRSPGVEPILIAAGEHLLRQRTETLPAEFEVDCRERGLSLEAWTDFTQLVSPRTSSNARRTRRWHFHRRALAEELLWRELQRQMAPQLVPTGEQFLGWARLASGDADGDLRGHLWALLGALGRVAFELGRAGNVDALTKLFELDDSVVSSRLLMDAAAGARATQFNDVSGSGAGRPLVEALIERCQESDAVRLFGALSQASLMQLVGLKLDPKLDLMLGPSLDMTQMATDLGARLLRDLPQADSALVPELARTSLRLVRHQRASGKTFAARGAIANCLPLQRRWVELSNGSVASRLGLAETLGLAASCVSRAAISEVGQVPSCANEPQTPILALARSSTPTMAQESLSEALAIARALVVENPTSASCQWLLCVLLEQRLALPVGEAAAEASAAASAGEDLEAEYRRLVRLLPQDKAAVRALCSRLARSARRSEALGNMAAARGHVEESLVLRRSARAKNPHDAGCREGLALALSDAARLQAEIGERATAKARLGECLAIRRAQVKEQPSNVWAVRGLLSALGAMVSLAVKTDGATEVDSLCLELSRVQRQLTSLENFKAKELQALSAQLEASSAAIREAGFIAALTVLLEEQVALHWLLLRSEPSRLEHKLEQSVLLAELASLREGAGDVERARQAHQQVVRLRREIDDAEQSDDSDEPPSSQPHYDLSVALRSLGLFESRRPNGAAAAATAMRGSLEAARILFQVTELNDVSSKRLCEALLEAGLADLDRENGLSLIRESLALARDFVGQPHTKEGEQTAVSCLTRTLWNLGFVEAAAGNLDVARALLGEGVEWMREAAARSGGDLDSEWALGAALVELGQIEQRAGCPEAAQEHFREALDINLKALKVDPFNPVFTAGLGVSLADLV